MAQALDVMCPMHLILSPDGRIEHVGPTLRKLQTGLPWTGACFFTLFTVTRPKGVRTAPDLVGQYGQILHLRCGDAPKTGMKGVATHRPDGRDGMVVNLSFGISVMEAVQTYALHSSDFAPTDLAVEMLYLVEAKSAVMSASKHLNERLQRAKSVAEEQAVTDALTGLVNRRGLERFLHRLITRKGGFAVMQVDLDGFKTVNDTLGHDAGDALLQDVAHIMTDEMRDRDLVARIGGDEFILVVDGGPDPAHVRRIADRLIDRVASLSRSGDMPRTVGCSIGAVMSDQLCDITILNILRSADRALYISKNAGRGRFTLFDPEPEQPIHPASA